MSLPLSKTPSGFLRLYFKGAVAVSGGGVQQSWDLTALPQYVRADPKFKSSLLIFAKQIDSSIFNVSEDVTFLPATGVPTSMVLTLDSAAVSAQLELDVWCLHSILGAISDVPKLYFIVSSENAAGAAIGSRSFDEWQSNNPPLLLNAGAEVSIPGPAAGFLRFFEIIYATSLGNTPILDFSLEPFGMYFMRNGNLGGPTVISSFIPTAFGNRQCPIGHGESFKVANIGTAACSIYYSYIDFPDTNRTLVRTQFSNTPVTIIPAAPTGYFHKPVLLAYTAPSPAVVVYNDDTVSAQPSVYHDSDLIYRSQPFGAGQASTLAGVSSLDTCIRAQALRLATAAPITSRQVNVALCYERFPRKP